MNPVSRLLFVIIGTGAYFALAILGWGGVTAFFAHPALVALGLTCAVMIVAAFFAGGSISSGEREDRGNRWVVAAFGIIGLLLAYLPAYTDRKGFWTIDGEAIRWLGVFLALRIWPVYVLGKRFSGLVAIQPGHTLVTNGIYSVIRNPSYLGLLLNSLGWGLAFRSWIGVMLTAMTLVPLLARIHAEERLLRSRW
jgi:protein-S-isoprenylcysteine O-methyltransferase Ste14